jgi:hypothetical protein
MIDIIREPVFPLRLASREARNLLYGRRGAGFHIATWHRWAGQGCRGVRLETIMVGGIRYTSLAAIARFIERLSRARDGDPTGATTAPVPSRARQLEAVDRQLDGLGL